MRLFTDWRGQAALSVLFAAVAVYAFIYLLDGGRGFAGIIVATNAVSSLFYGHGAIQARREAVGQPQDNSSETS